MYKVGDTFDGVALVAGKTETKDLYAAGDTFDGVTLTAGKTEEKMYKVGDTFDGVALVSGKTETPTYKAGDTYDGVTLVAGATVERIYKVGDTFDNVTLTAGKTEAADYKAGDTFDGVKLITGHTELSAYKATDTFDGIQLTANKTEERMYQAGDAFDNIVGGLVAGKTEKTGFYKAGDTFDGVTLVAGKTEGSDNLLEVDFGNLNTDMSAIVATDVKTASKADDALGKIDTGLEVINTRRAMLGATTNRLAHAVDNLTNVKINSEASRSRILDTNYAETTAELVRTQIISQTSQAMVSQANALPEVVVSLLSAA